MYDVEVLHVREVMRGAGGLYFEAVLGSWRFA